MRIDDQTRMLAAQALQNGAPADRSDRGALEQKAREFEAIFVQQVFKTMRRTVPGGGLLERGQAEEIYTELQDLEAARQLTSQRSIGLAEMLVEQLQKRDE